jgi:group I intron endonuclease
MFSTTGIYKIVNKTTGKYYVGSSLNVLRRWNDHVRILNKNEHKNDYLQNAWNKYGQLSFEFVIVSILPNTTTERELLLEEQKWLDVAINDPLTYNLTFVAGNPNLNLSDYSRKKRSESLKRVIRTPEWKAKISKSKMGVKPTPSALLNMSLSKIGKPQTEEQKKNATNSRRKHWDFVSPSGDHIHIYDLKRFCRENGLTPSQMYDVYNGKRISCKGWKPINTRPPKIRTSWHCKTYKFTSQDNKKIDVFNLTKFCRDNNLSQGCMHGVYIGTRKSHKGWRK